VVLVLFLGGGSHGGVGVVFVVVMIACV